MAEFENIQDLLNDFRSNVIREAKRNLTSQNTSGRLSKSLKSYVKESKNSIQISFEMDEYGFYQDEGVKGANPNALPKPGAKSKDGKKTLKGSKNYGKQKAPNSQYRFGSGKGKKGGLTKALDKWIVRKGIAPRNNQGQFMSRKTLKFLMARSIYLSGIKPSLFFTKPFEKYFKRLPDELVEKYGLDMEKLFTQITDENFKRLNK